MSNYLLELEDEITLKWPKSYDRLGRIRLYGNKTFFGVSLQSNPPWYICAEYDFVIITIDLFVIVDRAAFNRRTWSLTPAAPLDMTGVKRVQTYWVEPSKGLYGYETIHFIPEYSPNEKYFVPNRLNHWTNL